MCEHGKKLRKVCVRGVCDLWNQMIKWSLDICQLISPSLCGLDNISCKSYLWFRVKATDQSASPLFLKRKRTTIGLQGSGPNSLDKTDDS